MLAEPPENHPDLFPEEFLPFCSVKRSLSHESQRKVHYLSRQMWSGVQLYSRKDLWLNICVTRITTRIEPSVNYGASMIQFVELTGKYLSYKIWLAYIHIMLPE